MVFERDIPSCSPHEVLIRYLRSALIDNHNKSKTELTAISDWISFRLENLIDLLLRLVHPYQDGAQVLAVPRAALTAVENCRQSEDDPTICYEGTYHVMPFLQIVLFCKLPFCDAFCVLPFCVMPLCVMPFCVLALSVMPLCVMPFCVLPLCVVPLCVLPFSLMPFSTWYLYDSGFFSISSF